MGPKTGRDEHHYLKGAKVVTSQVVYEDRSSAKETYLQSFMSECTSLAKVVTNLLFCLRCKVKIIKKAIGHAEKTNGR